jgi:hypothetical protein
VMVLIRGHHFYRKKLKLKKIQPLLFVIANTPKTELFATGPTPLCKSN